MEKNAIGILLVLMLLGCVLAPGWKMSDTPTVPGVKIVPITADLVHSQKLRANVKDMAANAEVKGYKIAGMKGAHKNPYRYLIGPRDVLTITVWDHEELTIPAGQFRSAEIAGHLVAEDGTIFYPFVGKVKVAGKTVAEVREILTQGLSGKIVNPQLDVRVAAYRSQKVFIVGRVNNPGPQPITDVPLTIVDAISQAGDALPDGDKVNCILKRNGKVININLLALYEGSGRSEDYLLKDGDILYVPNRNEQKVFIMGEVRGPSTKLMNNGRMTLTEALGDVGGVNQVTANPELVYVIRGNPTESVIYHLDSASPDTLILANQFQLQPRDVVFVGTAGVTRWGRVISQILPTANSLIRTADVATQ